MQTTRRIDFIIIHCAVTPNGDSRFTLEDIDRWHRERGWDGCGYHKVICVDGIVEDGRPLEQAGIHARSYNEHSIGISLIGTDQFTLAQWRSLRQLITKLSEVHPKARVIGHYEVNPHKKCPCFDVQNWIEAGYLPQDENIFNLNQYITKNRVPKTEEKQMIEETKSIFTSKTFWGAVIGGIAGILPHFGVAVAGETVAKLVELFAVLGGAVLAVYGRITADKKIA